MELGTGSTPGMQCSNTTSSPFTKRMAPHTSGTMGTKWILIKLPNQTKHQQNLFNIDNQQQYRKIKKPLLAASQHKLPVDDTWTEMSTHHDNNGIEWLDKMYSKFQLKN